MQEAFWTTAETVAYDSEAQMLFLLLLRQNNNVPLLFDDVKKIEMMAWQDNPYMMYAYARLHDVLQYDNHSDIPSWGGGYGNIFQDERDVKFMVIAPFTIF